VHSKRDTFLKTINFDLYSLAIFNSMTWHTFRSLLQLLLDPNVGGVTTLLLAAIGSPGVESGVTLATNHLVTVVLLGQQPTNKIINYKYVNLLWKLKIRKNRVRSWRKSNMFDW
jgi:hypothetical protein